MKFSRRELFRLGGQLCASGYLSVAFALLPGSAHGQQRAQLPPGNSNNPRLDSWLHIGRDRKIWITTGRAELGQGVLTSLAQIAAEELDVAMGSIFVQHVDTDFSADEGYTYGSLSVEQGGQAIRAAAAHARRILLDMASIKLNSDIAGLSVVNGEVQLNGQPTGLDYWKLINGKQLETEVAFYPQKPIVDYRIVGSSVARVDIPAMVFASGVFIQDLQMENTLHARVVKPPFAGARLVSIDVARIEKSIGKEQLVLDGSFIAVVAEDEYSAVRAAVEVADSCEWSALEKTDQFDNVREWLVTAQAQKQVVHSVGGSADSGEKTYQATFFRPFQAHASISPSMSWALWANENLTIWSHAQGMFPLRGAISRVVGLSEDKVRCIHRQSSGVYGQNGSDDAACDAALIAMKYPGRPIRLQYSRQDEFTVEPYGSAMLMQVEASADKSGQLQSWRYIVRSGPHANRPMGAKYAGRLQSAALLSNALPNPASTPVPLPSGGADRNAIPLYSIPSISIERHFISKMPARVSSLRSLGAYANIFAIESAIADLAKAFRQDEFSYRIRHLEDSRAIRVLERLRALCREYEGVTEDSRGIAWARYKNSSAYCSVAAYVNRAGKKLRVSHLIIVVDAGLIINPDGARNQIEGGAIQATSWTLKESVRLYQHGSPSRHWETYPILRFSEVPTVHVEFVIDPAEEALGVGEASQGPTGAAIANAVANLTGKRPFDLPFQQ